MDSIDPELRDFILFCMKRRGAEWPGIYDEMATTAAQRLFRGLSYDELRRAGLSLSISNVVQLRQLVEHIAANEQSLYI